MVFLLDFGYSTLVSLGEGPRGGGAGPPFIFRPNLSLQGGLTKIIFDGGGGVPLYSLGVDDRYPTYLKI